MPQPPEQPQIVLVTPAAFDPDAFAPLLEQALEAAPVACLRLDLASQDPDTVTRAADRLRALAHGRDIPLVIARHVGLVQPLGLDGVHLDGGARGVREARKALGAEAIVGAFCGSSRHDGLAAGEAGADYIAFGPAGASPLGDGRRAEAELFAWWSEMIEVPVVAEGALDAATVAALAPVADFFAFGDEVWSAPDPVAALRTLAAAMATG